MLFFLIFKLQLGMSKSKHLLPVTTTTTTRTTTSPALRYPLEQSMNDTQKALSKFKCMVFTALLAILCGLLSLNLGSNTTTTATRFLIRNNGDEDVTIKILYCGVCHLDLYSIKNDWKGVVYPMVPGYVNCVESGYWRSYSKCVMYGRKEISDAITSASSTFSSWSKLTANKRSKCLRKWYDLIIAHKEDLSLLITLE